MPTITAFGVPHLTGRPLALLRQIIVPTLADPAGATAIALAGAADGAFAAGEHALMTKARPRTISGAGRLRMRNSEGREATLLLLRHYREMVAESKFDMPCKIS
jgi:hypothetical protein